MNQSVEQSKRIYYPYIVCFITGLFIFYKYLLQVSPSVMTGELMRIFHLTGAGLGNLTACFLYTYLFMQIPSGMILDQYPVRTVITITITGCVLFTLLFVWSTSALMAGLARAGIGFSAAFAFNAYMKMITLWVPRKHFAVMGGIGITIAMLGAIGGQIPLSLLVVTWGWQNALIVTAVFGSILAVLCWLVISNPSAQGDHYPRTNGSLRKVYTQFCEVAYNKKNWLLGLYCACAFAPVSAFGGLWGIPFLEQVYHMPRLAAAKNISLIYLGFASGCPLLGALSDYFNRRVLIMIFGTILGLLSLSGVIYLSAILNPFMAACLLFLFGFGMGVIMLCFAVAVKIQTTVYMATLISFINTLPSIFEAVTEPLIGKILDLGWDGSIIQGARVFSINNYHMGLSILPCYLLISLVLLYFIEDSS